MLFIEKLTAIRKQMQADKVSAYIIPSSDPHCSEYLSDHFKCLAFASGFTGSAGTLLITPNFAGLWTDSRYFIQAEEELANSGYELVKLIVPHSPEYIDWLFQQLSAEDHIAFDKRIMPADKAILLKDRLHVKNIRFLDKDYLSLIWEDRPELNHSAVMLLTDEQSGASSSVKVDILREKMNERGADFHVLSSLDDIAWLFNIRGADIPYNPVVMAHALIGKESTTLFMNETKLDTKQRDYFHETGIHLSPYDSFLSELNSIPSSSRVLLDSSRIGSATYEAFPAAVEKIDQLNPSLLLKAAKNKVEQKYIREAMLKDGVAMTRFIYWLEKNLGNIHMTERSAAQQLESFRAEQIGFVGNSFATISAYGEHGALPHYTATQKSDVELQEKGLFLLDSGGQYHFGTTDITRTLPLGTSTKQERTDYTLVLIALIEGSSCRFPKGTRGYQLDSVIRKPLWDQGINYGHGTGHGIGYFLNVHEGPQNIGPNNHPIDFVPGMVTSIEPGIYRPGKHGVRIENVVLTIEHSCTEFDTFYAFETLTLAHIDTALVEKSIMSPSQISWLNQYNQSVYHSLNPYLTPQESHWLASKTIKI